MPGRFDLFQREVKMVRIDHSQIYIGNDKLKDALDHVTDAIERRQYRQWMIRQEEIQNLKKAAGLLPHEEVDSRSHLIVRPLPSKRRLPREPGHNMADQSKASKGFLMRRDFEQDPDISTDDLPTSAKSRPNTGGSSGTGRGKSISVKMPNTFGDSDNNDGVISDLDSDFDDSFLDPGPFGRNLRRPQGVLRSLEARMTPRRGPFEKPSAKSKKIHIDVLMESLRLGKYPTEWYSTVFEPSDVSRRSASSSARSTPMHSGKGRRSRPQTSGGHLSRGTTAVGKRDLTSRQSADVGFSTVLCQGHHTSKTKRQLLQMVNQERGNELRPKSAVEQRLILTRENSKLLDHKVQDFVKSMDNLNKRNRIKDTSILDQL